MFTSEQHSESAMAVVIDANEDDFSRRLTKVLEDWNDVEFAEPEWESASSLASHGDAEENSDLLLCAGSYV